MKEKQEYIIPSKIMFDEDLTPNAKLLYAVLRGCAETDVSYTNDELYILYKKRVSERSIAMYISQLKEKGYIDIKFKYSDNGRIIGKILTINPIKEDNK